MASLPEDLQEQKSNIRQFKDLALRVLRYIPDVLNESVEASSTVTLLDCVKMWLKSHIKVCIL